MIPLLILLIGILTVVFFSSSYAYFKKQDVVKEFVISVGNLSFQMESDAFDENRQVTVPKNSSKEFIINVTSLNEIDAKYKLYYEGSLPDSVSISYSALEGDDASSGEIEVGETKNIKIKITNESNEDVTIKLGISGGLLHNEVDLEENLFAILDSYKEIAYAAVYGGTHLVFGKAASIPDSYNGLELTEYWTGIEELKPESQNDVPWFDTYSYDIVEVNVVNEINPISTAYWFYGGYSISELNLTNLNASKVTDMSWMFGMLNTSAMTIYTPYNIPSNVNIVGITGRTFYDLTNGKEYKAGEFPVDITESHMLVAERPAGLYDENDKLVASWDELVNNYGLDVETDYTSSTYKTSTSSPYYILNNNSELTNGTKLIIPSGVTNIGAYAFYGCSDLISITMTDSVSTIGDYAFYRCTGLTSVVIPDSVTSLGSYAFTGCTELTSVTIPDSITSIGSGTFGSTGLTSLTIPSSVTSIGDFVFSDCYNLKTVTIPDSVTSIGMGIFLHSGLTSVIIGDGIGSIPDETFKECVNLTSVEMGDKIKTIGYEAFYNCTSLEHITIPDSVTSIEMYAFYSCTSLNSITIPSSVTDIGEEAFADCESLTSLTLENGVTSIGNDAFRNCTGLTSVIIPSSVTSIGNDAFRNCTGLTSVYFECTTAPTFGNDSFYKSSGDMCTFYFKNSTVRSAFNKRISSGVGTSYYYYYYNSSYGTLSTNYNW